MLTLQVINFRNGAGIETPLFLSGLDRRFLAIASGGTRSPLVYLTPCWRTLAQL